METPMIVEATEEDVPKLLRVVKLLRPHLGESDIRTRVPEMLRTGYRIVFVGDGEVAYSFLGYREIDFLFSGRTLYIDDLATLEEHRERGYAGQLFAWIKQYAKANNFNHISLDSGFQRHDAYRFYLNQGLRVESLHFGRHVEEV